MCLPDAAVSQQTPQRTKVSKEEPTNPSKNPESYRFISERPRHQSDGCPRLHRFVSLLPRNHALCPRQKGGPRDRQPTLLGCCHRRCPTKHGIGAKLCEFCSSSSGPWETSTLVHFVRTLPTYFCPDHQPQPTADELEWIYHCLWACSVSKENNILVDIQYICFFSIWCLDP